MHSLKRSSIWTAFAVTILGLGVLSTLAFAPVTHADTVNSVTFSSSTCSTFPCPPNTVVKITVDVTVAADSFLYLDVWVFTPSGDVYHLLNPANYLNDAPGAGAVTLTCTIPFGGAGTMSTSFSSLTGCSGSNSGVWEQATGPTSTGGCNQGNTEVSSGEGSTSQAGSYAVLACDGNVSGTGSFSISSPTGAPEFPLGIVLLFAIAVPALLVLRKKALAASPSVP